MKKKMTQSKPPVPRRSKTRNPRQLPVGPVLDAGGIAWAKLLKDPCNAPLAAPCYQGGAGTGTLVRLEADLSYTMDGTIIKNNFAALFTPGLVNAVGGASLEDTALLVHNEANSATAGPWTAVNNGPGYATLSQYSTVRPVAACLQLTYGGTELNRGGFVSFGTVPCEVGLAASHTLDQLAGCCSNNIRMPASMCEQKWRPGEHDQAFTNPNFNVSTDALSGRNSILMVIRGVPNGTNIRFRLVTVYEVVHAFNLGNVISLTTKPDHTNNTTQHVLSYLDRLGNWAWEVGHTVANAIDVGAGMVRVAKQYGGAVTYIGKRAAPLLLGA